MNCESCRKQLDRHRELVRYDDVQIDVIAEGAGSKVVLLPSIGRASDDFDAVAEALARGGCLVLRPQPRGCFDSKGPMADLTMHDLARDVAKVIEHFGPEKAVLVGHAFGNWVARMTAVDYPQLVRGVVIAAGADKNFPSRLSENIRRIASPATKETEKLTLLQETFFASNSDASVWLDGWYPSVRESQVHARNTTDKSEWWSAGGASILDLQADEDPFKKSENRYALQKELGDRVSVDVIRGASHALFPEQPQLVAAAILKWMDRLA